jgi:hypothetical protein
VDSVCAKTVAEKGTKKKNKEIKVFILLHLEIMLQN